MDVGLAVGVEGAGPRVRAHAGRSAFMRGVARAIEYFKLAIEKDPSYPLAHTGLADTYAMLGTNLYDVMPPREAMPLAKAAAKKAIDIDDTVAEAHASLGYAKLSYDWDWPAAGSRLRRTGPGRGCPPRTRQAQGLANQRYVPAPYVSFLYVGLNDMDQPFAGAHQACQERSEYLIYVKFEPSLDGFRADRRFPDLLRRMGLER